MRRCPRVLWMGTRSWWQDSRDRIEKLGIWMAFRPRYQMRDPTLLKLSREIRRVSDTSSLDRMSPLHSAICHTGGSIAARSGARCLLSQSRSSERPDLTAAAIAVTSSQEGVISTSNCIYFLHMSHVSSTTQ